jgi:hypothetical protein
MEAQTSGLWWLVAVLTGAIGTAMAVYGIRQKDPLPLVFGIALGAVPMCTSSSILAAVLSVAVVALFIIIKKYR